MNSIKTKITAIIAMALVMTCSVHAGSKTTVFMNNGSVIKGNIIVQRVGVDVTVDADHASFVIDEKSILSKKAKKVKYENLNRQWKRWSLRNKALLGNANGRYLEMYDIKTKDDSYMNVVRIERSEVPKIAYIQIVPENYRLKWNDIREIRKDIDKKTSEDINDEVVTYKNVKYTGQIVSQKPGKEFIVRQKSGQHVTLAVKNIRETNKVTSTKGVNMLSSAEYTNKVVLTNGTIMEGLIVQNHYGTKLSDQYISLLTPNGKKEKILMSKVSELRTDYKAVRKPDSYTRGAVYVNEFKISKAKVITENGNVGYVDKKVFSFPEGVIITFKNNGVKFPGSWHLVALTKMTFDNGADVYGYTSEMLETNIIKPSSADNTGSMGNLNFDYLSPGYYALVDNNGNESYVIKITK